MNNTTLRKTLVATLSLGMLAGTTSCSSMSDGSRTRAQGSTLGAVAGAALGAALGLAAGGNSKAVVAGLAAGAAVGALAGYAWGDSIVKQKEAYASMEEYVRDNNIQLSKRIEETKEYNMKLQQQVARLRVQGKRLSDSERAEAQRSIDLISQDLATARDAQKEADGAALKELNLKIEELERQQAMLAMLSGLAAN